MKSFWQDLLVTSFGLAASEATALVLYLVEKHLEFSIYGLMYAVVIPAGAIGAGMVAACGYYFGALIVGRRPSWLLLVNMVLVSVSTFFTVYWTSYTNMEFQGVKIRDHITFGEYMDTVLQNQTFVIGRGARDAKDAQPMGKWGYGFAILQILGFAVGGVAVYGYLKTLPYCERCQKYLKKTNDQHRSVSDAEGFGQMVESLHALISERRMQEAVELHAATGEARAKKGMLLKSTLLAKECPGCGLKWLGFRPQQYQGNAWVPLELLNRSEFHEVDIDWPT